MRQRGPGVWEVRVALGPDPVTGRSGVRSFTVHGDRQAAEHARERWAAKAELVREKGRARPGISVGDLLVEWVHADHGWRPSTVIGYRSVVGSLRGDRLAGRRAVDVRPPVLTAAMRAWRALGCSEATVYARIRVLRSALGWACVQRIIDVFPLDGMPTTPHVGVRMHVPADGVRDLIGHAEAAVRGARTGHGEDDPLVHKAEQVLLLTRLAADSGARRGELAALRVDDLDGRVLTISRGTSHEIVGPTKTGQIRRITLGETAAELWRTSVATWRLRNDGTLGPWLFSPHHDHARRLTTGGLGHWFAELATDAGQPDVTLHRLRHSVATALVSRGDLLQAQYRLGHRDPITTLRTYSHVMPLTDTDAATTLDDLYR